MSSRYPYVFLALLIGAALAAVTVDAQTTSPSRAPATSLVPRAPKVRQPAEFVELATKAKNLKAVYIKGVAIAAGAEKQESATQPRRVEFEIWAQPPAAKLKVPYPVGEIRVSDGTFVYAFREKAAEQAQGRRRKLVPANYYHALEVAAVVCDAATGYRNLASQAKFIPVEYESKYAKGLPPLKWFRLDAAMDPPHHLLKDTKEVYAGINPKTGLMQALVGQIERDGKESTVAVVFQTVRPGALTADTFKLPAAAAKAEWLDAEVGRTIPAPKQAIASE